MVRFPNPGSDFPRFVRNFKIVHARALSEGVDSFDLDFATTALVDAGQVSSSGAVGDEALRRSSHDDRSLDPLYNQLKMYSELYRMLGWLHPEPGSRLRFRISLLGDYIARSPEPLDGPHKRLLQELLSAITFPNPNTANIGVSNSRPIYRMLQIMSRAGGYICRDELIVVLLTMDDDLAPGALQNAVSEVLGLRGSKGRLDRAVREVASNASVQVNTLKNYTRFPLGVLKSDVTGWADIVRLKEPYGQSMVFYELTDYGRTYVDRLDDLHDIRWHHLVGFPKQDVAHFANLCFYSMLDRSGFDFGELPHLIRKSSKGAARVLEELGIESPTLVLFSPVQEASHEIIDLAGTIEI